MSLHKEPLMIDAANPALRFAKFQNELQQIFKKVLKGRNYILGESVEQFENAFAAYIGVKHCVGVNSGTDALSLSLLALGVKPGDEVITSAISAPATVIAILNAGATPVIVDVECTTFTLSPSAVQAAITPRTVAIVPVHLHGFASNLAALLDITKQYNIALIEDCAQAHGAKYNGRKLGAWGDLAAFSFYPTKNLGCLGDGGAILTNDDGYARKLRELRYYGMSAKGLVQSQGINSRLDELQAAILRFLLRHLDGYNEARFSFAERYHQSLEEFEVHLPPIIKGAVYHQYAIRVEARDDFRQILKKEGIQTGIHYDKTMAEHPFLSQYCKDLPVANKVVNEFVSLPIQPEILSSHFEYISSIILSCLKNQ